MLCLIIGPKYKHTNSNCAKHINPLGSIQKKTYDPLFLDAEFVPMVRSAFESHSILI